MAEKWPRQYAADYIAARTKEEREAALKGCPEEWKGLVGDHVRIWREKAKHGIKPLKRGNNK